MAHIAFARGRCTARGLVDAASQAPLPMTSCSIDVEGVWSSARVVVRMSFRNAAAATVNVIAALDVPPRWKVVGLRYEAPGHRIKSCVRRFTVDPPSVAPPFTNPVAALEVPWALPGGHVATVTATFTAPVDTACASVLTFAIPAELVPAAGAPAPGPDTWKGRFTFAAPAAAAEHGVVLRGTLTAPHPLAGAPTVVGLAGLAAAPMDDPRRVELSFAGDATAFASAVVTAPLLPPADPVTLLTVAQDSAADAEHYAIAMAVSPAMPAGACDAPNVDLVIAVDCSGSMYPYAAAVQRAVRSLAGGLPASAHVNVLLFGDRQSWLFPAARRPDDATIGALRGLTVRADMGGSRLYDALADVYLRPVVAGAARAVLLISDGAEQKHRVRLVDLAAANRGHTRVTAVSVGPGADTALLRELADVSGGSFLPATGDDDVPLCVGVALSQLLVPCFAFAAVSFHTDGTVDPPPVRCCLAAVPLVPAGAQVVIHALAPRDFAGCTVAVSGLVGGDHLEFSAHTGAVAAVAERCDDADAAGVVHTAAAAARIAMLCDDSEASALRDAERVEVERLGEAAGVQSCVAGHQCSMEDDATTGGGRGGGGGGGGDGGDGGRLMLCVPAAARQRAVAASRPAVARDGAGAAVDGDAVFAALVAQDAARRAAVTAPQLIASVVAEAVAAVVAPPSLEDVLAGQRADGGWAGDDPRVAKAHGLSQAAVGRGVPPELQAVTARHRAEAAERRDAAAGRIAAHEAAVAADAEAAAEGDEGPPEAAVSAEGGPPSEAGAAEAGTVEPAAAAAAPPSEEELGQLAAEAAAAEAAAAEDPGREVWVSALAAAALELRFADDPRSAPALAKALLFLRRVPCGEAALDAAAASLSAA